MDRDHERFEIMVNYSASVTYALQALGEMFNRPDFKEEARIVASDLKKFFTVNDFFFIR